MGKYVLSWKSDIKGRSHEQSVQLPAFPSLRSLWSLGVSPGPGAHRDLGVSVLPSSLPSLLPLPFGCNFWFALGSPMPHLHKA